MLAPRNSKEHTEKSCLPNPASETAVAASEALSKEASSESNENNIAQVKDAPSTTPTKPAPEATPDEVVKADAVSATAGTGVANESHASDPAPSNTEFQNKSSTVVESTVIFDADVSVMTDKMLQELKTRFVADLMVDPLNVDISVTKGSLVLTIKVKYQDAETASLGRNALNKMLTIKTLKQPA